MLDNPDNRIDLCRDRAWVADLEPDAIENAVAFISDERGALLVPSEFRCESELPESFAYQRFGHRNHFYWKRDGAEPTDGLRLVCYHDVFLCRAGDDLSSQKATVASLNQSQSRADFVGIIKR